jgi:hypothetical protein
MAPFLPNENRRRESNPLYNALETGKSRETQKEARTKYNLGSRIACKHGLLREGLSAGRRMPGSNRNASPDRNQAL